jgi:dynein heavy chain
MEGAEEAERLANEKLEELRLVQEKVAEIVAKVNELKANLQAAEDKKAFVMGEAANLQKNLDLAERLVSGLAEENIRWKNNVTSFKEEKLLLIGNVLISSAFVSYIGPFSSNFRN